MHAECTMVHQKKIQNHFGNLKKLHEILNIEYTKKNYHHNLFTLKIKNRPSSSKTRFFKNFIPILIASFTKWTFINVQNEKVNARAGMKNLKSLRIF